MERQRTLAAPSARVRGVGLHSGSPIGLRLLPAAADDGISFRCLHAGGGVIELAATSVVDTLLATTIAGGGGHVATIEHLLAALCICGIDNLVIEIDGAEVPIMDGSAAPFVLLVHDAGIVAQERPKRYLKVVRPIEVALADEPGRTASFAPAEQASWEIDVAFTDATISRTPQHLRCDLSDNRALRERVARARTFGFVHEIDQLRKHNRALGGSLDNAVVVNGNGVLNENGLRQPDEFVAHKLLDVIGDCFIEGRLVLGAYRARMPGHRLNNELMRKLVATPGAVEEVTSEELAGLPAPDFGPLAATL